MRTLLLLPVLLLMLGPAVAPAQDGFPGWSQRVAAYVLFEDPVITQKYSHPEQICEIMGEVENTSNTEIIKVTVRAKWDDEDKFKKIATGFIEPNTTESVARISDAVGGTEENLPMERTCIVEVLKQRYPDPPGGQDLMYRL